MAKFPTPWAVQTMKRVLGEPDRYGEREETWNPPVTQKVYGWSPPGVEEELYSANRNATVQDLDVYVPVGFDIAANDRMIVDGEEFRVLAGARDFNHGPFGFAPGLAVRVKRVEELG